MQNKKEDLVVVLWLKATTNFLKDRLGEHGFHRALLFLNDGNCISIQASSGHYSSPRENSLDFYSSVEISYDSEKCLDSNLIQLLSDYKDCDNICGYVPIEIIEKIIEYHGGIDYKKSLPEEYQSSIRGFYRTRKINKLIMNNNNNNNE